MPQKRTCIDVTFITGQTSASQRQCKPILLKRHARESSKGSGFSPDAGNATTRYLSEATPQFFALLISNALGDIDGREGLSVVTATKGKRLVVDAVDRGSLTCL